MARTGLIFRFLLIWSLAVVSFVVEAAKGELAGKYEDYVDSPGNMRVFDFQVHWEITNFVGSPAVSMKFKWQIWNNSVLAAKPVTLRVTDIPADILATIKPYNIRLKLCGHGQRDSGISGCFEYDPGMPTSSGTLWGVSSVNVLDWERLFFPHGGGSYLSSEKAKLMVQNGLNIIHVEIINLDWSTYDFNRWLQDEYPLKEIESLKKAIARQLKHLSNSQQLDVQHIKDSLKSFEKHNKPRLVRDKLISVLEKLSIAGIPERFRNKKNEKAYREGKASLKAVDDIEIAAASEPVKKDLKHEEWVDEKLKELKDPKNEKVAKQFKHQARLFDQLLTLEKISSNGIVESCGRLGRYASYKKAQKWTRCSDKFEAKLEALENQLLDLEFDAQQSGAYDEIKLLVEQKREKIKVATDRIEEEFQMVMSSYDRYEVREQKRATRRREAELKVLAAKAEQSFQYQNWSQAEYNTNTWWNNFQATTPTTPTTQQKGRAYKKATFSYPTLEEIKASASTNDSRITIKFGEICNQKTRAERAACSERNRQKFPSKKRIKNHRSNSITQ